MSAYWIKFEGFPSCCVEEETPDAAKELAREMIGKKVVSAERLPYPALPRLTMRRYESASQPSGIVCPAFCFKPEQCKNNTACPQNYSCTE